MEIQVYRARKYNLRFCKFAVSISMTYDLPRRSIRQSRGGMYASDRCHS
jgi:hypothetical protein